MKGPVQGSRLKCLDCTNDDIYQKSCKNVFQDSYQNFYQNVLTTRDKDFANILRSYEISYKNGLHDLTKNLDKTSCQESCHESYKILEDSQTTLSRKD